VFSRDAGRALQNLKKHAVSFEEAVTIFADPDGLDWQDLRHAEAESRFKRLGRSATGHREHLARI
jgi:uncharacterized protein